MLDRVAFHTMSSRRGVDSFIRMTAGFLFLVAGGTASCGGDDTSPGGWADGDETKSDADAAARQDDGGLDANGGKDAGRDVSDDAISDAIADTLRESTAERMEEAGASDTSVADISIGDDSAVVTDVAGSGEVSADADETQSDASTDGSEVASPGPFYSCSPPEGALPPLATEIVAQGLTEPLGIEASLHDSTRLYIVEKGGTVRLVKNGVLLDKPFLDISSVVWHETEAGLLGLAFHPDYENNGRFWVYYTAYENLGSQLAEFHRSAGDPDVADPAPVGGAPIFRAVLSYIHQGGSLEFGGDGDLYLGLGERGAGASAQDLQVPLGKILRFDVTHYPYSIPPGNLPNGLPEIWDYGLRNPWRISFDLCTGDLFISDVGDVTTEEIDIERAGDGNRNYGWPTTEGSFCHPSGTTCDARGFTMPLIEYGHDVMNVIIGGYVYRGSLIPALRGRYVYSSISGVLYSLVRNGLLVDSGALDVPRLTGVVVSFGQDARGELYTAELDAGIVRRLVPR